MAPVAFPRELSDVPRVEHVRPSAAEERHRLHAGGRRGDDGT